MQPVGCTYGTCCHATHRNARCYRFATLACNRGLAEQVFAIADTNVFIDCLRNYYKETIKESVIEKTQPYIKDESFEPDQVKTL